jgi:hypothetical protein
LPKNLTPEGRESLSRAGKTRWAALLASGKADQHVDKMVRARYGYRKGEKATANGSGIRPDLAAAFDAIAADITALSDEKDADVQALGDAKLALSGNGHTKPISLVDACIVVQDAIERGELRFHAEDGKPAFYGWQRIA